MTITLISTTIMDGRLVVTEQNVQLPDGPDELSAKEKKLLDPGPENPRGLSADDNFLYRCHNNIQYI